MQRACQRVAACGEMSCRDANVHASRAVDDRVPLADGVRSASATIVCVGRIRDGLPYGGKLTAQRGDEVIGGDDTEDSGARIHDREPTHAVLLHEIHCGLRGVRRVEQKGVSGHDLFNGRGLRIETVGNDAQGDIAIGQQSGYAARANDDDTADAPIAQLSGGGGDRVRRLRNNHPTSKRSKRLGDHFGASALSSAKDVPPFVPAVGLASSRKCVGRRQTLRANPRMRVRQPVQLVQEIVAIARMRRLASVSQWSPNMNTRTQPERFVVLAALEGVLSDRVAVVAARFAANITGGELHLVHVVGLPARSADTIAAFAEGRAQLEKTGALAGEVHKGRTTCHVTTGDPCHEILQLASRLDADLVIVGTHSRKGLNRLMLGSVAELVVRKASCPVLVVREKDHTGLAPEIEPPCADCLETQRASKGEKIWCARHSRRHPTGHTHYEIPEPFALGSSIIRPS